MTEEIYCWSARREIYRCSLIQVHLVERKRNALLEIARQPGKGLYTTRISYCMFTRVNSEASAREWGRERNCLTKLRPVYRSHTSLPRSSFRKQSEFSLPSFTSTCLLREGEIGVVSGLVERFNWKDYFQNNIKCNFQKLMMDITVMSLSPI